MIIIAAKVLLFVTVFVAIIAFGFMLSNFHQLIVEEQIKQRWGTYDAEDNDWFPLLVEEETCHAGKDGDCVWDDCPQLRDSEPAATGRHCPIDTLSWDGAVICRHSAPYDCDCEERGRNTAGVLRIPPELGI